MTISCGAALFAARLALQALDLCSPQTEVLSDPGPARCGAAVPGRRATGDRSPAGMGPNFPVLVRLADGTLTHVQAHAAAGRLACCTALRVAGAAGDWLSSARPLATLSAGLALRADALQVRAGACWLRLAKEAGHE